ncbi:MAG: hypothetical protein QHC40_02435 [Sphingobium sp.]|nr:hypothetical protein [Sphingobium sp.]
MIRVSARASDGGELRAGVPMRVDVSVRDPASNTPLSGLTPALWLAPDDGEQGERRCERLVNRLAASAVPPEGTVEANGFDLIQATEDSKLALVDPLLNLASANIKAVINLGSVPRDWALDSSGAMLALAVPGVPELQLIDMNRFAVAATVPLGAEPSAVRADGHGFRVGTVDGAIVAVGTDGRAGAPERIGTGAVALSGAGETIVSLALSGNGAFIRRGRGLVRFAIGSPVAAGIYSPLADAAFALTAEGDALVRVPQDRPDALQRIALQRKARAIAASPDGRWLALIAADGAAVTVIDVARGRERWTIAANDPVIAADFSDAFLYLVHKHQGGATRVVFDPAGGAPGTVTIAAGSTREAEQHAGALPLIAHIPRAGVLVASGRDRAAYMINDDNAQAAMSSLPLRAGAPAGILLRYRGLAPTAQPGSYDVQVVVPQGGAYLAVVRTEQPAVAHCARLIIAGPAGTGAPTSAALPQAIERHLSTSPRILPGPQFLRFMISGEPAARLAGVTLVGDGWQMSPRDIASDGQGFSAPVDLAAGRGFTLFVRYRDERGEGILSTLVEVPGQ